MDQDEFHYRLRSRARGLRPGLHRATQHGDGQETVAHVGILEGRDPRRLDLLASARDPMRRLLVRTARQRSSIPVYLLADLSASLGFEARVRKLDLLADFTHCLARSAHASGDAFAFIGCDEQVRPDFLHPPGRARGVGIEIAARLRALVPTGRSAAGLRAGTMLVTRRDALVFLASDFHLDAELLHDVMDGLARCEVIPVVLGDSAESAPAARFGIARLRDPESGRERTVLMRPGLKERLRLRGREQREALSALFRHHGVSPLWLEDRFDADSVTRHFHA